MAPRAYVTIGPIQPSGRGIRAEWRGHADIPTDWQTIQVPVLLIRHGHAGTRKDWAGDDRLRPLTPKGYRQAISLVRRLEAWAPERILSSPYVRCVQTVQPFADDLGRKVEEVDDLAEGAGPAGLALVRRFVDRSVALCTHGDVILEVLVALADEDRLDLGPAPRQAKGSTWVLRSEQGKFVAATYVPPGR
ncbi:MAG TPA: phosphoglycerate mutase family protein [Acidimicrobiales bacterium]|nr:phosphoglycerate mutase family protein [Acidimicrobiales bacterium]